MRLARHRHRGFLEKWQGKKTCEGKTLFFYLKAANLTKRFRTTKNNLLWIFMKKTGSPPPPPPPQIKHATTALFAGRNNFQTTHRHALRITYHARLLSKKCSFMMKVYEATKKVVGAPKLSQENLHSLKRYYHFTLCYSSAKESNISVSLKPDFNTSTWIRLNCKN